MTRKALSSQGGLIWVFLRYFYHYQSETDQSPYSSGLRLNEIYFIQPGFAGWVKTQDCAPINDSCSFVGQLTIDKNVRDTSHTCTNVLYIGAAIMPRRAVGRSDVKLVLT